MVLKATANDRRHLALCHDEFRGPSSGLFQSEGQGPPWAVEPLKKLSYAGYRRLVDLPDRRPLPTVTATPHPISDCRNMDRHPQSWSQPPLIFSGQNPVWTVIILSPNIEKPSINRPISDTGISSSQ
ncbi:hypothetical protein TNCV_326171 [Trichonephila clavipes]|nr:hypothetical protein TNCV_326171 [Trichonephila clavipes]